MRIALVTSEGRCGIAEHSAMLRLHTGAADSALEFSQSASWLDPQQLPAPSPFDLVHLNYHRGLHSRWTPEVVARYAPTPFVITFHDTYEVQPDTLAQELLALDNVKAMVVHEPCDLEEFPKVRCWRQGVPERTGRPASIPWNGGPWRPTLGTVGFDFPWKNYDRLARITGELGWNLRIVGQVSNERAQQLLVLNPRTHFDGYVGTANAVAALESCDATVFLYECGNSGTSGAIRLGIAAGRPLIATHGCRQFRDMEALHTGILWVQPTAEDLMDTLLCIGAGAGPRGYDLEVCAFAHQERWPLLGEKYAQLYREAVRA